MKEIVTELLTSRRCYFNTQGKFKNVSEDLEKQKYSRK